MGGAAVREQEARVKLLLIGGNGQVGWQLRRSLATLGNVFVATREGEVCGDLAQPERLMESIRGLKPDVVVNAGAYTAVDRAEDEPDVAFAINGKAVEAIAEATAATGSWLVHYSSDYVYRGDGTKPWVESDPCEPMGVYGKSKLAGDRGAVGNPRHLVFRTSWVFDSWGGNFVKSILKAATQRDELKVVCDQWGAPTRAALIADVTAFALREVMRTPQDASKAGIYHLAPTGETNWNEYARFAIGEAMERGAPVRATPDKVHAIPAAEYAAKAPRPANSRLDTSRLRSAFGITLPAWQAGVRAVVAELCQPPLWDTAAKERK
jgi:dTDP-4-dehydrorhamnose reductase